MNLIKNPLFYLSLILAVIVGFQAWSLVQAGTFAEPTSAFPASDVSAPVETGEIPQTKYQTLSFAPATDENDVRVSVGLLGLGLDNGESLGYASSWDMVKDFVRVWSGPDTGIISYEGGVKIEREGGLSSMELDSDGNVEIAGSLTTGSPSKIWIRVRSGVIGGAYGAYLCGAWGRLYGEHEMNCVDISNKFISSTWEWNVNSCVKNMRLYVYESEHATEWPLYDVGSYYEDFTHGTATNIWNVSNNTLTVTVWKDSSKGISSIAGCTFVTKIRIDGVDGSPGSGWIKGHVDADEIWVLTTAIFGD